jgi:hypothetical protein
MRALLILVSACWTAAPAPDPVAQPAAPRAKVQERLVEDAPTPLFMLQLDATHLYWIGGGDGEEGIWRAEKKPYAEPVRLAETVDANGLMLVGDRLWWGDERTVRAMPKAGGTVATVVDNLPRDVYDIALFGPDLFVAMYDTGQGTTEIRRYSLDGKRLASTQVVDGVTPIMIARAEGIYIGSDNGLVRVTPSGGIERLSSEELEVQALFIDTDEVMFGTYGAIHRAPRTAIRLSRRITRGDGAVSDLAADDRHVYWGSTLDEPPGNAIWRAPKAGGRSRLFVRMEGEPGSILIDGDHVYWTDTTNGTVTRRRRDAADLDD